jgi:hypothetical protein
MAHLTNGDAGSKTAPPVANHATLVDRGGPRTSNPLAQTDRSEEVIHLEVDRMPT